MDPNIERITNEIIKLADQISRETVETEGYLRRQDYTSALRNTNDHRDELQDLNRKHQDLIRALNDAKKRGL